MSLLSDLVGLIGGQAGAGVAAAGKAAAKGLQQQPQPVPHFQPQQQIQQQKGQTFQGSTYPPVQNGSYQNVQGPQTFEDFSSFGNPQLNNYNPQVDYGLHRNINPQGTERHYPQMPATPQGYPAFAPPNGAQINGSQNNESLPALLSLLKLRR